MPTLVVRGPDGKERDVALSGDMTIGRAEGCDLVLAEGGVSRQHAKVTVKGDAVVIEDTGSANGTYIEGQRIGAPTIVPPGKKVQLGDYELRVKAGGGPALAVIKRPRTGGGPAKGGGMALGDMASAPSTRTMPKRAGAGAPAAPERRDPLARRPARPAPGPRVVPDVPEGPSLIGTSGLWKNKRWAIAGKIVVGRLPGVDVQLDDDSVSRRHAELELTPRGVRLKDLNSANGTAVNGMPVEGTVTLQSGDIIQFGVVELSYEYDSEESLSGSGEGRPRRFRLVVVAMVVMLVLAGATAAKVLGAAPGQPAPGQGGPPSLFTALKDLLGQSGPAVDPKPDPGAAVQELLAACRSHMSPEHGEPDWNKAEAACQKVLEVEPIQEEATNLIKKIREEMKAKGHFDKADNLTLRLHEEEALDEYGFIPQESYYYIKVKPKIPEAVNKALKRTWDDCQLYVKQRDYKSALPRCEQWLKLACQNMPKDDVTPPPGFAIRTSVTGKKLGEHEWAPPNPAVLKVYQVREKIDPNSGPYKCAPMPILRFSDTTAPPEPPGQTVAKIVAKKYPPIIAAVVMDYYAGRAEEAGTALQRIRQDLRKTELHRIAEDTALDMNEVASLYKNGQTLIQSNEVDKAAERYRQALSVDEKLMVQDVDKYPSWFREAILRDIADATLQAGRTWMQRNDRKTACKYWRMGFEFTKGNVELNRAVGGQCSTEAGRLLSVARSCADLDNVMSLAIEGDDIRPKVEDKRKEWGCQPATAP